MAGDPLWSGDGGSDPKLFKHTPPHNKSHAFPFKTNWTELHNTRIYVYAHREAMAGEQLRNGDGGSDRKFFKHTPPNNKSKS